MTRPEAYQRGEEFHCRLLFWEGRKGSVAILAEIVRSQRYLLAFHGVISRDLPEPCECATNRILLTANRILRRDFLVDA